MHVTTKALAQIWLRCCVHPNRRARVQRWMGPITRHVVSSWLNNPPSRETVGVRHVKHDAPLRALHYANPME